MAKKQTRRFFRRATSSRRRTRRGTRGVSRATTGILPMTLGGLAVAVPFLAAGSEGKSPVGDLIEQMEAKNYKVIPGNFVGYILDSLTTNAGKIAGLAVGAGLASWAGSKFGLARHTRVNRKWSIF